MQRILKKATENKNLAENLFEKSNYDSYANRIYYAFYQLGCYLRNSVDYQSSPHSALKNDLKKIGEKKFAKHLYKLKCQRVKADYELEKVTESEILGIKANTDTIFCQKINKIKGAMPK